MCDPSSSDEERLYRHTDFDQDFELTTFPNIVYTKKDFASEE